MADNKRKKKADGKRVALKQDHEREYLLGELDRAAMILNIAYNKVTNAVMRLRAGFPKARRK